MTARLTRTRRERSRLRAVTIAGLSALGLLAGSAAQAEPAVRTVAIDGTSFRITLDDGRVLSGTSLVGMTLTMADAKGGQLPVRIDAVQPDPKDPTGEITLYAFSVADAATGGRRNLCGPDPYNKH